MLKLPNSYKKNHVKIFINQIEMFEMSFNNIHESTATNVFSMLVSAIFFVFLYIFFLKEGKIVCMEMRGRFAKFVLLMNNSLRTSFAGEKQVVLQNFLCQRTT